MLADYTGFLCRVRNSFIQNGVGVDVREINSYSEVFQTGEILNNLSWFFSIMTIGCSEDSLKSFIFPLNAYYNRSLRDRYFEEYLLHKAGLLDLSIEGALEAQKLEAEKLEKSSPVIEEKTVPELVNSTDSAPVLTVKGYEPENFFGDWEFPSYDKEAWAKEEEKERLEKERLSSLPFVPIEDGDEDEFLTTPSEEEEEEDDFGSWGSEDDLEEDEFLTTPSEEEEEEDDFGSWGSSDEEGEDPEYDEDDFGSWGSSDSNEEDDEEDEFSTPASEEEPEEEDDFGSWGSSDDTTGDISSEEEEEEDDFGSWGSSDEEGEDPEYDEDDFGSWGSDEEGEDQEDDEDDFGSWGSDDEDTGSVDEDEDDGFGSWGDPEEEEQLSNNRSDISLSTKGGSGGVVSSAGMSSKVKKELESNTRVINSVEKILLGAGKIVGGVMKKGTLKE